MVDQNCFNASLQGNTCDGAGVAVFWKVYIQPAIDSDSTDGEIRYMYNSANKNKAVCRYMEHA